MGIKIFRNRSKASSAGSPESPTSSSFNGEKKSGEMKNFTRKEKKRLRQLEKEWHKASQPSSRRSSLASIFPAMDGFRPRPGGVPWN